MHRTLRYFALTVAVLLIGAPWAAAQKTQQIFVRATGANGAPLSDLKASEVNVTEDGVACKVLKVEPAGPTKLQLLVDNGEVNTTPITGLRDGLEAFFAKLPDGVDVSVYTTAPQSRPIVKNTTDKKKLVDAIAVIAPDRGAGMFFESLLDAVDRVDRDKAPGIPVIVVVGSDVGAEQLKERDIPEIQQKIIKDHIRIDVVLMQGGRNTTSRSGLQPEIGLTVTKISGGKYDFINSTTRLATLLPEMGERIAQSVARQGNQYRVTYEAPGKRNATAQVSVSLTREAATVTTSFDGH
jgi:hypothetical protein